MATECRVALFSPEYPPHIFGGLGTHVQRVTSALAGPAAFELFVPDRGGYDETQPAVRLHQVPVRGARTNVEFWLRYCRGAVRAAERIAIPDLVHCHDWMTILAGIHLRARWQVPLVYNIHLPQASTPTLALENLGMAAADLVLVNSQAVRREIMARDLPARRVEVVPNGVDPDVFRLADDWPADGGYVLFVGRLVPQKGVDLLLQAFGVVLRRCPARRLIVAGDGDLELYLKRVTHYLGFPQRVVFAHWQTGPALVELYQKAQLVVMPSYYEPFGIVALEAMACGRPVIASQVGGLEEIVQDGVQGYLVPAGDYLQLARRMAGLILDPALRRQMGQAAREQAARFAWSVVAGTTMTLYRALADSPPAAVPGMTLELERALLAGLEPPLRPLAARLLGRA
jgi:glycosyltransferase involved in cell wall biosynthesis